MREAFPDMIFDGELYRHDVNKISYVLGSYRDFLDTRGRFPDLESGTWGGRERRRCSAISESRASPSHAIDRLLAHLGANRQDTVAFGDAAVDIPSWSTARSAWAMATVGGHQGDGRRSSPAMSEEDGLARAFERLG